MKEMLLSIFEPLKAINPIIYTIVISLVPLIELRGAILVAIPMGMVWWQAYIWSVLGSMIPAFFVIPLFAWGLQVLETHGWCPAVTKFLNDKFVTKANQVCEKTNEIDCSDKKEWQKELLKFWTIVVFVAIPLPGTGVYTGSAIASIIKMPFWKAFLAVLIGDMIAGAIMVALTLGGMKVIG